MLAVFQKGLNSFYDSIEIDQPPLSSPAPLPAPCCSLTLPIFYALSRLPQKPQRCNLLAKPQRDRRTDGPSDSLKQEGKRQRECPTIRQTRPEATATNNNKSSRNLRYLCCEYAINIVAPSGIDLAHSIGRTDSGTDSSHSLCQWQCQSTTPSGHISTRSDVRHLSPFEATSINAHVGRFKCSSCIQCTFTCAW